ncbi:acetoacetate decarboxylase family protein [Streptomyces sp. NPDC085614]|uniref:acetoacetate decarboxylase family protein n=1 Tax=Streptomyces sp. NPDC085614 TaxID=3365733 RepID=UPI0037CDD593
MPTYPPEPWHLAGQMFLSLWVVPRRRLPVLPDAVKPLTVAGRAVIGGAWVVYERDSVLHYNELLTAVLVRDGLRPRVTITDIWVDSEQSRDGGRRLWGIPKDMARFDITRGARITFAASERTPLASAAFHVRHRLPGRWPASYQVCQDLDGRLKTSPVRSRSTLRLARGGWEIPARSAVPLPARPPTVSLALEDFTLTFGAGESARSPRLSS